ncbi:MAG: PorT family protein [Bacteroidales bacterium]|nr:PorT family protein [Bacteroidales bacterium]
MKRFLMVAFVSLVTLICSVGTAAQNRFVVSGGLNFSTSNVKDISKETMTQYHAGIGYKWDIGLGFAFQPSLLYSVKGAAAGDDISSVDFSVGYLEFMPSFQWGPDLLLFRPYLDLSPYVGYGLSTKASLPEFKDALNKFEYGVGLGVGIEIWRLQIVGRYNWNFGTIASTVKGEGALNNSSIQEAFGESNLGGITLTASILF